MDKGQIIGTVEKGLGCPVHASVSGKVLQIEDVLTPMGRKVTRVVIENDGEERLHESITHNANAVAEITPDACIEAVRLAVVRQQGMNYMKADDIPAKLDDKIPQQALVSAMRKYSK